MQGSYVEFSFIEKLHARITEVSPANPGETLNDAVERLIAELDAAEADARECRAERARYGDAMTARLAGVEAERDALRADYRLLVERVKAVTPYAANTASWVTLLATIGIEPEDMHFSK